ncbi:TraB/GumN family protein [Paracoccus aminophilus]|uniref:GumN family protein n=1 Tax=Paracoccus aminophilus JCM 7686 TaxID=1367847 RepID=S5XNY8_PARAH|nr:TraB/GumN family protein [Paracoccus aminophilus]AGT09034.1 hypothetical protein JCM7686_1933 [Paracoccus aminophilus JCM 7686]
MRPVAALLAGLLFLAPLPLAAAECVGQNLIAQLSPEVRAELDAAVAPVPYHKGTFWQATRGSSKIVLLGTYHFGDDRHATTITTFAPEIDGAQKLLVEAGPKEQAQLQNSLKDDPSLITDAKGPTLPERMEKADWDKLSKAMSERGIPSFVASRMRPWYVAMMMGLSPCMIDEAKKAGLPEGLDELVMRRAEAHGVPIEALEPWDTVFRMFAGMSPTEEIEMLRSSLPAAEHADDYATTLIDAYFKGDIWEIWEFGRFDAYANSGMTRADVDEQMKIAQDKMMDRRNQSWIGPLEAAAQEAAGNGGYVVAAFGALHLPGEAGVLRLLERDGWTVTALPSPHS